MKTVTFFSQVAPAVLVLAGVAVGFQGTDKKQPQGGGDGAMDPAKMMAMMPKPGPEHAMLQRDVGVWDCTMTAHIPGMPPQESKAVETQRAHGPFFVHGEFKGSMMGQSFTGFGVMGYDPARKVFTSVCHDDVMPYLYKSEGTYDEKTKTLTLRGEGCNPMDPAKTVKSRMVIEYKSADSKKYTMYEDHGDGKEIQTLVIEAARRK
jgi:hypothetical protein